MSLFVLKNGHKDLTTADDVHMQTLNTFIYSATILLANLVAKPLYEVAELLAIYDMALVFSQQQAKLLALLLRVWPTSDLVMLLNHWACSF